MNLKPGEFYDCFAEHADFHEGKNGGLFLKVTYRFPKTGDKLDFYHTLIRKDGTVMEFPVDRKNPDGPKTTEQAVLEARYGFDLSQFEVDQSKLTPEIIVRALIEEKTSEYKGQMRTETRIKAIYPTSASVAKRQPVDKASLMRRFGSALRAGHAAAARTAPAVAKPNAPAPAPAEPVAAPPKPAYAEPPSTLEECWSAFCAATPDMDEGTRTNEWFALLQRSIGHQKQESATPQEWGRVKTHIDTMGQPDEIPF